MKKKKIENYENDYNYYYNIIQPHMKYTPRSDLERIYNDLGHIPNNLNVNSKKIVDTQLNKMGFKPKVETNKNFPEDIIDLNFFKSPSFGVNILSNSLISSGVNAFLLLRFIIE